ncbi:hypothetical protein LZ554_008882 [Drepanopeziza brunnea f. sp. 'monogermtubi']|nr:hypothetical protein LZ554_008882 [Drepanopeziza brunnea f. sp. 'monogermtubi']
MDNPNSRVVIPDLFESFLSRAPKVNPQFETVRDEALAWASEKCGYNEDETKRMRQGDLGYFAAVSLPEADPFKLRTVIDWFNWLFVFDDQLDDGPLSLQKEEACRYIDGTLALLNGSPSEQYGAIQPIQQVIHDIWKRVREDPKCSLDAKLRWLEHTREYLTALGNSIDFEPRATLQETIAGYMEYRIHTFATLALFSFVEYAYELQIPNAVFQNQKIVKLEQISIEIQIIVNDCVSYHREKDQNCPHNVIHLLRHHGFSEQGAYDEAHKMLRARYKLWHLTMADVPVWGEKVDREVSRYVQGIQDVALANVNWSFRTERYFGKDRYQVRATRILESRVDWLPGVLLPEPREVEAPTSNNGVGQEDGLTGMVESSAPNAL